MKWLSVTKDAQKPFIKMATYVLRLQNFLNILIIIEFHEISCFDELVELFCLFVRARPPTGTRLALNLKRRMGSLALMPS